MKSTPEHEDASPVLGAPIRQSKPAAAPVPVAPGVVRTADGKLETRVTPPQPTWDWRYGVPVLPGRPVVHEDEQTED